MLHCIIPFTHIHAHMHISRHMHAHAHTHTHTHTHACTHTHTHLQEEQEVVPGSTDVQKTSKTQTVESHVSHKGVLILNTRKQLQDTWTH